MERKSLENQLFTWKNWDEGMDAGDMQFFEVELTAQVGAFPAGTKFPRAYMATSGSFVVFLDEDGKDHIFELTMTVGKKLTAEDFPHEEGCGCGHDHD